MKYDIVVVGSGLGGLECAHILSRFGKSVLVLEKGSQPGGCIQSYRRGGMLFDTGFHYVGGLGEGQSLHAAFKSLGLLRLPWVQLDRTFDRVTIGAHTFSFHQGYDAFVEVLAADFPQELDGLKSYANLLRTVEEHQLDVLNPSLSETLLPAELFEKSAFQYLEETFHDEMLINVLSGTSLKMELRRESLPLFTFLHGNSSFIESSWRLQGDGSLIAASLANDIQAYGGKVVCHAEVQELVEKDGRLVQAICADGTVYEGDLFISDVHPAVTCSWIKQSQKLRKAYRTRISGQENTFGMLTVSLVMKPQTLKYFNYNRYVYRHPDVWTFYQKDGPAGGILMACRMPEDGEYARQVDLLTPMRWSECEPWSDTRVGRRGDAYKEMKERRADECIALAETVVPCLREMISARYVSTPLTYRDYTSTPQGSAYGMRKDFRNPMQTVLSPRTPIPNLYLTGQNLVLHGLHGVTMTSLFTCAEIVGKERIWNMLRDEA